MIIFRHRDQYKTRIEIFDWVAKKATFLLNFGIFEKFRDKVKDFSSFSTKMPTSGLVNTFSKSFLKQAPRKVGHPNGLPKPEIGLKSLFPRRNALQGVVFAPTESFWVLLFF